MHNHISILGFLAATINFLFHFYTLEPSSLGAHFTLMEVGHFFYREEEEGQ